MPGIFFNKLKRRIAVAVDERLDFFAALTYRTAVRLVALVVAEVVGVENRVNRVAVAFLDGGENRRDTNHDTAVVFDRVDSRESGFSDYSSFVKSFRKLYGITPMEYREQLKNAMNRAPLAQAAE